MSVPPIKSEFANAPDIRPLYDTKACYQFKILSDNRAGFYCRYVRVRVTKGVFTIN